METYYLGAYWQPRQESLDDCTRRIHTFLSCAEGCDPCFAHWYRLGRSRAKALNHALHADPASIRSLTLEGAHRGADGKFVEELGYHVSLWNGAASDDEAVNLSITCGGFTPSLRNACVISLPANGKVAESVLSFSVLKALVECTTLAFDPDWCVVMPRSYRDSLAPWSPNEPRAGWLLYVSHRLGKLPEFRWPVQVDTVNSLGVLIVSTTERFSVNNVAHVQAAATIDQALRESGLLSD